MKVRHIVFTLISTLGIISGCSTTDESTQPSSTTSVPLKPEPILYTNDIDQLLDQALKATSPKKEEILLRATTIAVDQQQLDKAKQILALVRYQNLNFNEKALYLEHLITIALAEYRPELALKIFDDPRYALHRYFDSLNREQKLKLSALRAETFELNGNLVSAIRERLFASQLIFDEAAIQLNNDAIWNSLIILPQEALNDLSNANRHFLLEGWMTLLTIYRTYSENIDLQIEAILQWQSMTPQHPAAQYLPSNIYNLILAARYKPQKLAVLMPQSGRFKGAADIIMSGFLGAYYSAQSQELPVPEIEFYDSASQPIDSIYEHALLQGADMIIGPLSKEKVRTLANREALNVPTLALNYLPSGSDNTTNLYQFGLAAEDEVSQIAARAHLETYRYAGVIYPDTEWGHRISNAFIAQWEALQGEVVTTATFKGNGDFTDVIKTMLNIDDSQARSRSLNQTLGERLKFTPRRRRDIDFVVMLGAPQEARQIVPTLAYYYAKDIPVYATSHIYSGAPDPTQDKDLNKVSFVDLPWLLKNDDEIKNYIYESWPEAPRSLPRLQAMGVDAYRLYRRLAILQVSPNATVQGSTGKLSLENGRIKRTLTWARFKQGEPTLENQSLIHNLQ